jgi:4-amino-4-deoxy-L-arabinose transferase-like glycosyltransferase
MSLSGTAPELATADVVDRKSRRHGVGWPRRRPLGFELALVVLISLVVLVPGIWRYSLVDPWETHYGEVSRMMLQNNDWVHTEWPQDGEGFRSKPVLQFWMMAAGLRAVGVGENGGYSGEMADSAMVMVGIRLPFILSAIAGLTLMWWMLARLISRRMAWLGLLVVGSTPIFCMVARTAMPDMPMVACTIGAVALFMMAVEDGERRVVPLWHMTKRRIAFDARHVVLAIAGAFVGIQAIYYLVYFLGSPQIALRGMIPNPALWLPLLMALVFGALHRDGWLILRIPLVLIGGVIGAIVNEPLGMRLPNQSLWRHIVDNTLRPWDRHAPDRYLVRALSMPVVWASGGTWKQTATVGEHAMRLEPITQMRQVYLLGCYFLLGISVLAKGPPGLTVVGGVMALHVIVLGKWRDLYDGRFEVKRGLLMMIVVSIPWHVAMFLKDGIRFIDEYLFTHVLNRAAVGVDNSPGTFEYYTDQLGHGMWLWAALLPAAITAAFLRARLDTREGRVRFMTLLWAIVSVAIFCLVQTKFHHYILPAIPPLALIVAFLLDDVAGGKRLHPLYAAIGSAIVLLLCRDLMHEPERWIEMFVFRYDRPWPAGDPWSVDPSDGFLALGLAAAIAIPLLATRFVRIGVAAVGVVGLAICVWALQSYMPHAGTHWGMREAVRTYYQQRTIYGQKLVYFGAAQLHADWHDVVDTWRFETFVPDTLHEGQPMTIRIQVNKAEDERIMEAETVMLAHVSAVGDHSVTLKLAPGELTKLAPLLAQGAKGGRRSRPPVRSVDADRLIAWQLYWRGENFWSGDEIYSWLPEMKTAFVKTDNVEFTRYINDKTRAPLGRRYFLITEAGRISGARSMVPSQRAQQTFEILDTSSNKFSIAAFWL